MGFKRHVKVALILVVGCVLACAQQKDKIVEQHDTASKIRQVFLNIHGEARPAHRMWTYLDFELEDRGFLIVDSEQDADAIVDVELESHTVDDHIEVGVVQLYFHSAGQDEHEEGCATLGNGDSSGHTELFALSGQQAVESLQKRFPKAHSVKLDPASDMAASRHFRANLDEALKENSLALVSDGPADVVLRVNLGVERVPIEEQSVHFRLDMATRTGKDSWSTQGEKIFSVKLKSAPPEFCPDRFNDFDWLDGTYDQLFQAAENAAKNLAKTNLRRSSAPTQKPH